MVILICLATARMSTGGKPKPYQTTPLVKISTTAAYKCEDEQFNPKNVVDVLTSDEKFEETVDVVSELASGVLDTQHENLVEVILFTKVSS